MTAGPTGGLRGLTVLPTPRDPLDAITRAQRAADFARALVSLDPEFECEHGTLPTDPRPRCTCWTTTTTTPAPSAPVPPPPNGRVTGFVRDQGIRKQQILCGCGRTWTRKPVRGRVPKCPRCRTQGD